MKDIFVWIIISVFKGAEFISECFKNGTPLATGTGIILIVAITILIAAIIPRPKSKTK